MSADETPAARVEPMSEERILDLYELAYDPLDWDTDGNVKLPHGLVAEYYEELIRLRAVIAERDAEIRELLPMAEAWYDHNCESGGYDPINGDWATEQFRHDEQVISQAKALVGEAVPDEC